MISSHIHPANTVQGISDDDRVRGFANITKHDHDGSGLPHIHLLAAADARHASLMTLLKYRGSNAAIRDVIRHLRATPEGQYHRYDLHRPRELMVLPVEGPCTQAWRQHPPLFVSEPVHRRVGGSRTSTFSMTTDVSWFNEWVCAGAVGAVASFSARRVYRKPASNNLDRSVGGDGAILIGG